MSRVSISQTTFGGGVFFIAKDGWHFDKREHKS